MHPSGGIIRALFCALFLSACGDCANGNHGSNNDGNNADESFREAVGEWTPEACDSGADEDQDGAIDCADADCYTAGVCVFEPAMNAPQMGANGVVSFWDHSAWLFQGDSAPQRGVAEGAITPENIGTITGRIVDTAGEPVAGAALSFAGHPDLGRTYTRADGRYDLAFDVSRRLYVRVRAPGHITSDRRITPRLRRPGTLGDIAIVPHESEPTTIDFTTTAWVDGTTREDEDGIRHTGVVIPEGRLAKLTFPNGASRPIDVINVRATEVTVGDSGRDAMMADLAPQTLYTYAAEFSVDEAEAENATGVEFDRPVYIYVDNFLGMPTGSMVPSGYYDRDALAWEPSPNGYVIEIIEIAQGEAVLSLGDAALPDADREALGVTAGELKLLAQRYEVGDTLWRIPTQHFSPLDCNFTGVFRLEMGADQRLYVLTCSNAIRLEPRPLKARREAPTDRLRASEPPSPPSISRNGLLARLGFPISLWTA